MVASIGCSFSVTGFWFKTIISDSKVHPFASSGGLSHAPFGGLGLTGGWPADGHPGVTGSNYMLVDDDEGRTIQVRVTFTDDLWNEETLTSVATEAVDAKPNAPATGIGWSTRPTATSGSPMSEVRIRKSPARWMLPIRWWPTMQGGELRQLRGAGPANRDRREPADRLRHAAAAGRARELLEAIRTVEFVDNFCGGTSRAR